MQIRVIITVITLACATSSVAALNTWTGGDDNNWFNAGNWSGDVPADGEDVIIGSGANTNVMLTNVTAPPAV